MEGDNLPSTQTTKHIKKCKKKAYHLTKISEICDFDTTLHWLEPEVSLWCCLCSMTEKIFQVLKSQPQNNEDLGAPGWLSRLTIRLWLGSWSQNPCGAPCSAGSLLLPLLLLMLSLYLSIKKKKSLMFHKRWNLLLLLEGCSGIRHCSPINVSCHLCF